MKFIPNTDAADITGVTAGTNLSGGGVSGDVTISLADASTSAKGAASFASADFGVSSGAVSLSDAVVKAIGSDSGTANSPEGHSFTITGGEGIDTSGADSTITIAGEEASTSNKGVASFDSNHFVASSGAISLATSMTLASTTITNTDLRWTSATSEKPLISITNTTNDTKAGTLKFKKDKGSAGEDGDDIGTILFTGDNAAQEQTDFASIIAEISEADDTDEAGKLTLNVAESDGSTSALSPGLVLEGEHATDGQVDATIGNGSASTTTVAGDLSVTTGLILDSVDVTTIQTGSESFTDNDTSLMTSAAIQDKVQAHYSYQYTNFIGNSDIATNWAHPSVSGANAHNWNVDTGEAGTTVNSTNIDLGRSYSTIGFTVPFTGVLVGFYGTMRNNNNSNQGALGLFHTAGSGVWGTTGTANYKLQAYAVQGYAGGAGSNYKGGCYVVDLSRSLALTAGDIIIPAVLEATADKVYFQITMVIKTLIP